jgi:hypothetical protein
MACRQQDISPMHPTADNPLTFAFFSFRSMLEVCTGASY